MAHGFVTLADARAAAARIAPHVVTTPLVRCEALDGLTGLRLFFKCENLQATGSFKARGASSVVFSLSDAEAARGVVTHSSGNHGAATARAATRRGIPCRVIMPENAAPAKIANVRRWGVEPTLCGANAGARAETVQKIAAETGSVVVHPFDDLRTMAGQATVALELLDEAPEIEDVVAPVGGGGLMSGVASVIKSLRADIRVTAAEPAVDPDAMRSWQSGEPAAQSGAETIADGLRTPVGRLTLPILRAHVDRFLLASEDAIMQAARQMLREAHLVVEPSGAVALAAVIESRDAFPPGAAVAVVLSGGNADLAALCGEES